MLDSLVRVSRRVAWNHYASVLGYYTADHDLARPHDAEGYNAPEGTTFPRPFSGRESRRWPNLRRGHPAEARMIDEGHGLMPNASLSTISRTVSLSFQSTFHLSITLLVYYRSLANI